MTDKSAVRAKSLIRSSDIFLAFPYGLIGTCSHETWAKWKVKNYCNSLLNDSSYENLATVVEVITSYILA